MEPNKNDGPKLPDMVMCGDHPSLSKTELNVKEKPEEKKAKEKMASDAQMSPSRSAALVVARAAGGGRVAAAGAGRCASEAALRLEPRRRPRPEPDHLPGNRALVQAALGSFRWPPYLLCVWVIVLVLTHVLHCLVTVLERALPNLKKFCQYFRTWTEQMWKVDENHRMYPVSLAAITGLLYVLYFGLYILYSVALWSIEPLCSELDETKSSADMEAKITDYEDSKTDVSVKNKM